MNKRHIIIIVVILMALAGIYFLVFRTYCESSDITHSSKSSQVQEVFPGVEKVNCTNYFKLFLMSFSGKPPVNIDFID